MNNIETKKEKDYNAVYNSIKDNFINSFDKSKQTIDLFDGTSYINIDSNWFENPSKPETNTIHFVRLLIEEIGINSKKIIEEKKISRDKTEFFRKFYRYPDLMIVKSDESPKHIIIEVEAIGQDLEKDIKAFETRSYFHSDGTRDHIHGIAQTLEWFHEFVGLSDNYFGMTTNFRDWYLIKHSEKEMKMIYTKISIADALEIIEGVAIGEIPDYFISDFGTYEQTIDKFYKEFNLRLHYIIQNLKGEKCEKPNIMIMGIPSALPEDEQIGIAIKFYRINFFRLLFIRILEEWKLIKFDPVRYIFSLISSYHSNGFKQLFFDVFNEIKKDRSPDLFEKYKKLPYLNGGLFRKSPEEKKYNLSLPSDVFKDIWGILTNYHFTEKSENVKYVNPEILGYIFERTLDATGIRKDSGSYYTPDKITYFVAERTINNFVVDELNTYCLDKKILNYKLESIEEIYTLRNETKEKLFKQIINILKKIKICDSACGSGAFLQAAAEKIIRLYRKIYKFFDWELKFYQKSNLKAKRPFKDLYQMKKHILQNNIYGLDLIDTSVEICKLRLWLWLIQPSRGYQTSDLKESLPNIDFNIANGNSLIGYINLEEIETDLYNVNFDSFQKKITDYYTGLKSSKSDEYDRQLILHDRELAYDELMEHLRSKFESVLIPKINRRTKKKLIKPNKDKQYRRFKEFKPFHWIFDYNQIMVQGGFDILIGNPPWNAIKSYDKEFFYKYDERLTLHGVQKKESDSIIKEILENDKDGTISSKFQHYKENIKMESAIFRQHYKYKSGKILGKTISGDFNYYKMFMERNYNLVRDNGQIGLVLPAAFYSDAGTKGLRELYFDKCKINYLIGFINRKLIFKIHGSTKFIVLLAKKGEKTEKFRATFMQRDIKILNNIEANTKNVNWLKIKNLNPESYSIIEFNNEIDKIIVEKLSNNELLLDNPSWLGTFKLSREFDMTLDKDYFIGSSDDIPLYEGKHIEQYTPYFNINIRYWIEEAEGLKKFINKEPNYSDYQDYRMGFRDVTSSTNKRAMIASLLPRNIFCGNTLITTKIYQDGNRLISNENLLYLCGLFNSTVFDYLLRLQINVHLSLFFIYQMPIPKPDNLSLNTVITNVLKLTEDWEDFLDLRNEFEISGKRLSTDERISLNAEIDAIFGNLFNLNRKEMEYILDKFHHKEKSLEKELRLLEKLTLEKFSS